MCTRLHVLQGDITTMQTDVVVNAANSSLLGGGGVDGAIHKAGGNTILMECMGIRLKQGGCKPGEAVLTSAGNMPSSFVIHTVGPVWQGGMNDEYDTLYKCYYNTLALAKDNKSGSISFPNIATGIYGFPKERAANIAMQAIRDFFDKNPCAIADVYFVCFDEENYQIYQQMLEPGS